VLDATATACLIDRRQFQTIVARRDLHGRSVQLVTPLERLRGYSSCRDFRIESVRDFHSVFSYDLVSNRDD
jgi:hypothetical protein